MIGLNDHDIVITSHGRAGSALRAERFTEIGVIIRDLRPIDQGLTDQFDRAVAPATLMSHDAQKVKRVTVVWCHGENPLIEPFGFAQMPDRMVSKGLSEQGWNARRCLVRQGDDFFMGTHFCEGFSKS
ncbi:MAG: hypothetical protein P4M00_11660 [Azospirillaceae bacterium]|nr:hypothetical protein [Azospirillaceae bacterium]